MHWGLSPLPFTAQQHGTVLSRDYLSTCGLVTLEFIHSSSYFNNMVNLVNIRILTFMNAQTWDKTSVHLPKTNLNRSPTKIDTLDSVWGTTSNQLFERHRSIAEWMNIPRDTHECIQVLIYLSVSFFSHPNFNAPALSLTMHRYYKHFQWEEGGIYLDVFCSNLNAGVFGNLINHVCLFQDSFCCCNMQ